MNLLKFKKRKGKLKETKVIQRENGQTIVTLSKGNVINVENKHKPFKS